MKHRLDVPDYRADREAIMAKIIARVEISPDTGCWNWTGHITTAGYAGIYWERNWFGNRLVYAATHGFLSKDLDVCHSCDNRACVNPDHLRADTHLNNLLEASDKKRLRAQLQTHCKRGHPLSGDNLYVAPGTRLRNCKTCTRAKCRRQMGWPEHLWFADIIVPPGYTVDRKTGEIVAPKRKAA